MPGYVAATSRSYDFGKALKTKTRRIRKRASVRYNSNAQRAYPARSAQPRRGAIPPRPFVGPEKEKTGYMRSRFRYSLPEDVANPQQIGQRPQLVFSSTPLTLCSNLFSCNGFSLIGICVIHPRRLINRYMRIAILFCLMGIVKQFNSKTRFCFARTGFLRSHYVSSFFRPLSIRLSRSPASSPPSWCRPGRR